MSPEESLSLLPALQGPAVRSQHCPLPSPPPHSWVARNMALAGGPVTEDTSPQGHENATALSLGIQWERAQN